MIIKMVYEGGSAEIVEKKSRFIASVFPVHSEQEALDAIAAARKKYWDASHNCSAFVIGQRQELARCSDDGEPQGTAGRPMLDVLLGEEMHDTLVIVTRYFGGTLLGTGGLVRAYSAAAQAGLKASKVIEKQDGFLLTIRTDYNGIGKIQYLLGQRQLTITNSTYTEIVEIETLVPTGKADELISAITEATSGRAAFPSKEPVMFAFLDGEPLLL